MAPPLTASLYCCWNTASRSARRSSDGTGSYTCQSVNIKAGLSPSALTDQNQHTEWGFNLWSFQLDVFWFIPCCLWSFTQEVHKATLPLRMFSQSFPMILHGDLTAVSVELFHTKS